MLKVLIATGGTGGHLFPARQLSELLADCEVLFAGYQLDHTPFFDRNVPYVEISSASKKSDLLPLLKGFWQALRLLWTFKPDVVVGFGSFYSFPVVLAAAALRKKLVLFEANCTLGKVNQWFRPFAETIAFQFPVKEKKASYVPLLPWIGKRGELPSTQRAREHYQLQPHLFTLLVFGGSQGARFLNETVPLAIQLLLKKGWSLQVIHLTGKAAPEIKYETLSVVKPFEAEMTYAYAAADMVICRCGAGTTAELIRFQKPALLIPYPYAYDHQRKNGEWIEKGARLLLQRDATPERMAQEVEAIRGELDVRREALRQMIFPQTVDFGALVKSVGEKK